MTVSDTDSPSTDEWVRKDQWFIGSFAKQLNRALLLHLGPLVEEYDRSFAKTVGAKTSWRIRRDVAAVLPWGARARFTDEALEGVSEALQIGFGFLAVAAAPGLLVSDGPLWLKLVLVCGAAVLALRIALSATVDFGSVSTRINWAMLPETLRTTGAQRGLDPPDNDDRLALTKKIASWLSSFVVLASLVLLVWVWPAPPHGALAATGIAVLSALVILLVVAIWSLVAWDSTLRYAMIALTVVVLAGYGQWWLLGRTDHADWWYAPEFGALLATVIGVVLAALRLGHQLFRAEQTFSRFRKYAEPEFVQSAMRALHAASSPGTNRVEIVRRIEYLAVVLERGVAGRLRREDPTSAADIASVVGARAAALRARKRDVLFGKPGAADELRAALQKAVIVGADEEWTELEAAPGWTSAERPRLLARVARLAVRVLIFVLPFAIGAVVALVGDTPVASWLPAAVPFALGWVAVNLAELIAPGSGKGVADTAAGTDLVAKRLRGR